MPPPSRAHTTAAGSYQARQNRSARARHSLDDTGFSIDSSELPSGLIVDYSIDDVVRPSNIAELGRGQQIENVHLDDEDEDDEDADIEEGELGKANSFSSCSHSDATYVVECLITSWCPLPYRESPERNHQEAHWFSKRSAIQ